MPRALWWSRGVVVSYERGTPVGFMLSDWGVQTVTGLYLAGVFLVASGNLVVILGFTGDGIDLIDRVRIQD